MTALEITHLYCKLSGGKVGEDSTTHKLQPRSAGAGLQIHRCAHCGRSVTEIIESVQRVGLECGGRPGDDLHHVDGVHRSSAPRTNGRTLLGFEKQRAAHFGRMP